MPEKNPIDLEMDALLERLKGQTGLAANAYTSDPLASDHLLLRQSWGFFKRRVATIENQWRQITDSKNEEIQILKTQLGVARERLQELESDRIAAESFLRSIEMARLEDHENFRKEKDKTIQRWEEERIALEADRIKLEQTLKRKEDRLKEYDLAMLQVKKEREDLRVAFREAEAKWGENQTELIKSLNENILEKDAFFQSEQLKVDLLRREVEHRNQLLKDAAGRETELAERLKKLEADFRQLKNEKEESDVRLAREQEDLKRFHAERARMLDDWQREKAEWRELWDRRQEGK